MLNTLYMENIAVIEKAELIPERGFNVLTGETGAGKSIILDALGAISGGRTSRELIRTGQTKASVQGVFSDLSERAIAILHGAGIEAEDGQIVLSREMYADGRNLCRAGGRPCPLSLLRELGEELVTIHGQHDGRALLDAKEHLNYLDAAAHTEKALEEYRGYYTAARELRTALLKLEAEKNDRLSRLDILSFQISELRAADLREGELSELEERKKKLENAKKLREAFSEAKKCLDSEDGGVLGLLSLATRELIKVAPLSADATYAADRVGELSTSAEELFKTLSSLAEECTASPEELEEVKERIDTIHRLCRKYGGDEASALAFLEKAQNEANRLTENGESAERLSAEYRVAIAKARESAANLTNLRKTAAETLSRSVERELAYLEMPNCRFEARFYENGKLSPSGGDKMEFFLSPNPGEEPKPLAKIASGGELSRICLALRNVFRENNSRTLVFDEIDTGISGRAAQRVGEKLFGASMESQVLCVTHLAQIAAMGDAHFYVSKEVSDGRTVTHLQRLTREQRATELSRITGGYNITDTLLAGAEEMLSAAENYKKENFKE